MNTAILFNTAVTLRKVTAWSQDRGVKVPAGHADTSARASVQAMRADRRIAYELPVALTAFTIYVPADPALAVDDLVVWSGRTLRVLAPALDQAGRGVVWALDCVEVA